MSAPVDVLAIPGRYWRDYADRMPLDPGQVMVKPVGKRGHCILIRADDPGIPPLLSDARFYANTASMDECPRDLRESARRAVAALARVGGRS